jgi:hypothetical protein
MSWLRLDDRFDQHPKFAGWTFGEKWAWLQVMLYCARYETRGRLPTDLSLMPRTTTQRLLNKAVESGWLESQEDGALWVHDWAIYNPSPDAERMRVRRAAERIANTSPNDSRTNDRTNGEQNRTPRARASAPVPVPSPEALRASSGDGNAPREGEHRPQKPDPSLAVAEARSLAERWTTSDSNAFDEALDEIERQHRTKIAYGLRCDLWDEVLAAARPAFEGEEPL